MNIKLYSEKKYIKHNEKLYEVRIELKPVLKLYEFLHELDEKQDVKRTDYLKILNILIKEFKVEEFINLSIYELDEIVSLIFENYISEPEKEDDGYDVIYDIEGNKIKIKREEEEGFDDESYKFDILDYIIDAPEILATFQSEYNINLHEHPDMPFDYFKALLINASDKTPIKRKIWLRTFDENSKEAKNYDRETISELIKARNKIRIYSRRYLRELKEKEQKENKEN